MERGGNRGYRRAVATYFDLLEVARVELFGEVTVMGVKWIGD